MELSSKKSIVVPLNKAKPIDPLTELCREGARKMLQSAIEQEVSDYIERHQDQVDDLGHRLVVRNGFKAERTIQTGIGNLPIHQPRIDDRRTGADGDRIRFHSSILPPYLRRTKAIEELIPWLYLKGVSTGDFADALTALVGTNAPGLSATTVTRLKADWLVEYHAWNRRSLADKQYVYIWADGIYPRIRLDNTGDRQCLLVIMGATLEGRKELVAVSSGLREDEMSWRELLLDLKQRGLTVAPRLAIGDGALGFWCAIEKVFPSTTCQRCWVHKTANVLNKLPKSSHSKAKPAVQAIWMAETKADAEQALSNFVEIYGDKYPKAADCLTKDRQELLAFYDFPAAHWKHIRTTNPIESCFATVRLRTKRTKGHGSASAALAMIFKLAQCASKRWQKLAGVKLLADVIDLKIRFENGVRKAA